MNGTGTEVQKLQAMQFYGRALLVKGDKAHDKDAFDLGLKTLEAAQRKIPASSPEWRAEVLGTLATAYSLKGDDALELKNLDEAIRLSPGDPDRLNSRCYLLAKIGRLKQALADCNESLNLRPNDLNTLDSRALTYLKLKQPDSAIKDYEAVLRVRPKNARALYGRGIAELMHGNKNQGTEDIAAAKAIQPGVAEEFARYGVK